MGAFASLGPKKHVTLSAKHNPSHTIGATEDMEHGLFGAQ